MSGPAISAAGNVSGSVRSRALAAKAAAAVDRATLVTFTLDNDFFAVPVENVERVLRSATPAPVGGVPEWVEGSIEYRSSRVPLVDLRKRFGRSVTTAGENSRVIVFNTGAGWIAAVVDSVKEVVTIDVASIRPAPAETRGLAGTYLLGITTIREWPVLVPDIAKVLTAKEAIVLLPMDSETSQRRND